MCRLGLLPFLPLLPLFTACGPRDAVIVASKNFTESLLLGEIVAQQLERYQVPVERRLYLGGTFVCHQAIVAGQIDLYVEYTGTAYSAVLKLPAAHDTARVRQAVDSAYRASWGIEWMPPFGFNNTFAILVRRQDAARLGIRTVSQTARYTPGWKPAFGYEFVERADGYRGLVEAYGLRFATRPATMDLALTYRALAEGRADFIAGNSTDGLIKALDLFPLEDDRHYFPPYEAAPVVRSQVFSRFPAARKALEKLAHTLTDERMRELNYQVDVGHQRPADVAAGFLAGVAK